MRTFYTAFCYDGVSPHELHCTHKYLGKLTDEQAAAVLTVINMHFLRTPAAFRALPEVRFTQRALFGPNRDIPVLLPHPAGQDDVFMGFFTELRNVLGIFRNDDCAAWNPHVTTTLDSVIRPFDYFALVSGKVIVSWR